MKQRGSALIIAMMLIATVGAAAFGIARLLYVDTAISTTYENGTLAYYAAESGIEEGFLRYKYNMNAEVPYSNWVFNEDDPKIFRTNLMQNHVFDGGGVGREQSYVLDFKFDPTHHWTNAVQEQIYDLRMGYLGTYDNTSKTYKPLFYNDVNNNGLFNYPDVFDATFSKGDYSFLRVPKDEAKKFDLSNLDLTTAGANALDVGLKFIGVNPSSLANQYYTQASTTCKAMAEIKFLVTNAGTVKEYKALTSYNPDKCAGVIGIEAGKLDAAESSNFSTGGFVNGNGGISAYVSGDRDYYYSVNDIVKTVVTKAGDTVTNIGDVSSITIKPLYYPADVFFFIHGCAIPGGTCPVDNRNNIVTGPYSYLTSTGYYGGATRTLKANIDRQSGTLYDLYDYVLYKGN